MKKKISLFLILILLCALFVTLSACNKNTVNLIIDGDVSGDAVTINLQKIKQEKYTYQDDGTEVKTKGWNLKNVLNNVDFLYDDNYLMITAEDGVSAVIEANLTGKVYLYQNDDGKLCSKGIDYPRAVGIKDISEITVVTKDDSAVAAGYKILTVNKTEYVSRGNAKLKLYKLEAENKMNENYANKYILAEDNTVSNFTGRDDNVTYLEDYDILKNSDFQALSWEKGKLLLTNGEDTKAVFGFATGAAATIMDAYEEMKKSIDNNEKVMFILPDGFSWQQAISFTGELSILSATRAKGYAVSTNLSISPVALAAIVTGRSPYITGIHFSEDESRAVLKPNVPDIFEYATSKGKTVSYLEGSGNLIIASVSPVYGLTDSAIYDNAKTAISQNKDLIFVHFHEIDDVNHKYGALSSQSKAKCLEIDSYIADLKTQFDGKIIIVPDHGHNTLYDENNVPYGKHGMFTNLDMYVPYFVYD